MQWKKIKKFKKNSVNNKEQINRHTVQISIIKN